MDLENPRRYTEKIQWYKLNYNNPIMKECVDKFSVREYVEKKGLGHTLNQCYGIFDNINDIDYSLFPQKFVCKDTLGSGSNSVIVVDKEKQDFKLLERELNTWTNEPINKKHPGREWPYDNQKHRIVVEKYLEQRNGDLADYKFYCFNGKVDYFYVRTDYMKKHNDAKMSFFDRDCTLLNGVGMDYCKPSTEVPSLPQNIKKMVEYAEILSEDFPHARVDFYNVDGQIIFGEITFYNASGYMTFIPDDFDFTIGNKFILPKKSEQGDNI